MMSSSKVRVLWSERIGVKMSSKNESLLGMLKPMMIFTGTWRLDELKFPGHLLYWLYSIIFQGLGFLFVALVVSKFIEFVKSGEDSTNIIAGQVFFLSTISISGKVLIYQIYKISDTFKAILVDEEALWWSEDHEAIAGYQNRIKYIRKWNWGIVISSIVTALSLILEGVAQLVEEDNSEKDKWRMFPIWLPFRESDHKVAAVAIKCVLTCLCASLYMVSCMIFLALMIYSVGLLKMERAKIRKYNWDSYDMISDPSADIKALTIYNRRVFG